MNHEHFSCPDWKWFFYPSAQCQSLRWILLQFWTSIQFVFCQFLEVPKLASYACFGEERREVWRPSIIQAEAAHIFIRIKYANPKNFNLGLFRFWVSSNARFSSWHSLVIDGPKIYSFLWFFSMNKMLFTSAVFHYRTHVSSSSKQCFKGFWSYWKASSMEKIVHSVRQSCTAFLLSSDGSLER